MTELETLGFLAWLAATSIALLVAWGRIEVKIAQTAKSVDRLGKEFDTLHPRRSNPGHRVGIRHTHDEPHGEPDA